MAKRIETISVTKLSILALVGVISFGVSLPVSADASPPLYPPGSAVLPPGETMVQMIGETVEITIVTPGKTGWEGQSPGRAQFEANFVMRNQGAATEQMDVRFPLTDDASWETIWDFAAFVDGSRVRVRKSVEPFAIGDTRIARWAVFPVTFQPGVDVLIKVTYSTSISGWGWRAPDSAVDTAEEAFYGSMNPDTATVYYVLESGAGWYGPIERGRIILRLPYAAGRANVFDLDAALAEGRYSSSWGSLEGWNAGNLSGPSFAGNEASWEFSQLEPTAEDNLSIQFLWPEEWQRIVTLLAAVERNPTDPAIALELAGAYLAAGADSYGESANEAHCILSRQAIDRALAHDPSSEQLLEGLDVIAYYCPDQLAPEEQGTATPSPTAAGDSVSSTPSPYATSTALPTVGPSRTAQALQSPTAVPTAHPSATKAALLPTATEAPPGEKGNSRPSPAALIGIALVAVIALGLVVVRARRSTG
jgi:hypothetical protein